MCRDQEQRHGLSVRHPRYLVIPKIGMNITPYTLYLALRTAFKQLRAQGAKIDLIDAHYFYPDGVAASWLARDFNIPFVITARGTDISLIPDYAFPRQLIVEAAGNADGLITVCQALKDRLVELGVAPDKVRVLRNGVDLELFAPRDRVALRTKAQLSGFLLASVGHLIERKGHHHVLRALAAVARCQSADRRRRTRKRGTDSAGQVSRRGQTGCGFWAFWISRPSAISITAPM